MLYVDETGKKNALLGARKREVGEAKDGTALSRFTDTFLGSDTYTQVWVLLHLPGEGFILIAFRNGEASARLGAPPGPPRSTIRCRASAWFLVAHSRR